MDRFQPNLLGETTDSDDLVWSKGNDRHLVGNDPQGPQIDIVKDVLPFLSTEFHIATEIVKPISPDSKRSIVIIKLNDRQTKLPKILDRYGKGEPDSKPIDFEGYRKWSFETKHNGLETGHKISRFLFEAERTRKSVLLLTPCPPFDKSPGCPKVL